YPTSVNLDASTFVKGASAIFAKRRAISVFPTPVAPIKRMLLGIISLRKSLGTFILLHLFRSAIETFLLASFCPMIYLSSSATISRGVKYLFPSIMYFTFYVIYLLLIILLRSLVKVKLSVPPATW